MMRVQLMELCKLFHRIVGLVELLWFCRLLLVLSRNFLRCADRICQHTLCCVLYFKAGRVLVAVCGAQCRTVWH
jgi:hypothetical protein